MKRAIELEEAKDAVRDALNDIADVEIPDMPYGLAKELRDALNIVAERVWALNADEMYYRIAALLDELAFWEMDDDDEEPATPDPEGDPRCRVTTT